MATTFRLCGPGDLDSLTSLVQGWHEQEGLRFDLSAGRAGLARLLSDSRLGHVWRIEQGAEEIGYTMLSFRDAGESGGPKAYVSALYLTPAHRARGIGRRAAHFLADVGRLLGVRVLNFGTEGEDKQAQMVYRKVGMGREQPGREAVA